MNKKNASNLIIRRAGFTLVEVLIVLFLSVVVLAVSARLFLSAGSISDLSEYFVKQEAQARYTAERINNSIKYTNALFTIPRKSFSMENLTEGWSYLGVMDNVFVPSRLIYERNGSETFDLIAGKTINSEIKVPDRVSINDEVSTDNKDDNAKDEDFGFGILTRALVYIKYIGSQKPGEEDSIDFSSIQGNNNYIRNNTGKGTSSVDGNFDKKPYDQYVYTGNVEDGYFVVTIIDYELYDVKLGYKTEYNLVFDTTNDPSSGNIISGSLKYTLNVNYLDDDGKVIAEGRNIALETMLNGINILQAVSLGSGKDPATAIAFHEGGFKVDAIPHLNIIFVLDLSGSMNTSIPSTGGKSLKRIQALANNVEAFIDKFQYDSVYVSFVEFETYGKLGVSRLGIEDPVPIKATDPLVEDYIKDLYDDSPTGGTNLGDGFRIAYSQLEEIVSKNRGAANIIIKVSDGFTNAWSVNTPTIMVDEINNYNQKADENNLKKLDSTYRYKLITASEVGGKSNYYWDTHILPEVILYMDVTGRNVTRLLFYYDKNEYVQYNFSYGSSTTKYKLTTGYWNWRGYHETVLYEFTYRIPSNDDLLGKNLTDQQKYDPTMENFSISKDYAAFTLGKIFDRGKTDPNYSIAAFYDIYVNAKDVQDDESGMIRDALEIGQSRTEYYSFTVDNTAQFNECIGRIVANINTAAWLLSSPRV